MSRAELAYRLVHAMLEKGYTFDQEVIEERVSKLKEKAKADRYEAFLAECRQVWSAQGK